MTKIVVITHGCFAKTLVQVAEEILEKDSDFLTICFDLKMEQDELQSKINETLAPLVDSHSIIILTDLFGGTPSNLTIPLVQKEKIEVITGLNLAMLIYLMTQSPDTDFETLCNGTKVAGKEAIVVAGEFLP